MYTPEALKPQPKSWIKPKFVLLGLLAAVAIEVVLGIKTLMSPVSVQKVSSVIPLYFNGSGMLLEVPAASVKTGDTVPVKVILSTGLHTAIGTDLVLSYDPGLLEASKDAFTKGSIYSDYPYVNVDPVNGIISASGVASGSQKSFKGAGVFGTVAFKAKAPGRAVLTIEIKPGTTNYSNVIDSDTNQNVLEKVSNLEIEIK